VDGPTIDCGDLRRLDPAHTRVRSSKAANAETVIVDFLADLHRLVDLRDLDADFEQLSERGRRRYAGPGRRRPEPQPAP
jgi:hypothetical protein